MTVAYVVLSHRNPPQVLRLVRALAEGPGGCVLVRHDPRHSELSESAIATAGGQAIEDAIDVEWARWSHLALILSCLAEARDQSIPSGL